MIQQSIKNYLKETVVEGVSKSKEAMAHGVLIGIIIGFLISMVDFLVNQILLNQVHKIPTAYLSILPLLGFILVGTITTFGNIKNTSMADEIVKVYHLGDQEINIRYVINKFLAFVITILSGLTVGLEGACKWLGGITGVFYFRFLSNYFYKKHSKPDLIVSMMSGASAGISAIFKAPLSGTIMALESPFKKDFAHKTLIQSFISAVTSYTIFTALRGSDKFFIVNVNYRLQHRDIFYAALLGLFCGIISTILIKTNNLIKQHANNKYFSKFIFAGITMSMLSALYYEIYQSQDVLFSGIVNINKIFDSKMPFNLIFIIFCFRFLTYTLTFSFGGFGGQFLPSAALGVSIGYLIQNYFNLQLPHVFTLLGISSFITASYNGLLFGPVLIAEITGQSSLVVLGIVSSSISFLVTNGVSNSNYQKQSRDE